MIKIFAVGAMAVALVFGSTFAASAQSNLSAAQSAAMAACSGPGLSGDGGAACAIALRALPPAEFAAIEDALVEAAGTQVATLEAAIESAAIETGAVDAPVQAGPAVTQPGAQGSAG